MSSDTERLFELAHEISHRLGGAFGDMIPPDAQRHLLNAQRELLTAIFLTYEHQMGARRPHRGPEPTEPPEPQDIDPEAEEDHEPPRPRRRVNRIDIE